MDPATSLAAPPAAAATAAASSAVAEAAAAEASAAEAAAGGKRKRVVLSIHEKQQVLQRLELGEPPAALARAFGISRQQVSDIKKNRARILAFCGDAKHLSALQRKTLRAAAEFHPGVEQELYRWVVRQRRLQRGVSPEALAARAAALFQQYAAAGAAGAPRLPPPKSVAGWLRHFRRAHGLRALSSDELAQLPDEFAPAMEMSLAADAAPSPSPPPPAAAEDDVSAFMAGAYRSAAATAAAGTLPAQALPLPLPLPLPPRLAPAGLAGAVEAAQRLNAQLGAFEHAMALKLDLLDARVEKLCFAALPARFP